MTRPGMPLDYIAEVGADFAALFFDGIWREVHGERAWGWR